VYYGQETNDTICCLCVLIHESISVTIKEMLTDTKGVINRRNSKKVHTIQWQN